MDCLNDIKSDSDTEVAEDGPSNEATEDKELSKSEQPAEAATADVMADETPATEPDLPNGEPSGILTKDQPQPAPSSASTPSLRRDRKSTNAYTVTDFRKPVFQAPDKPVLKGRGARLGDLAATKASLEAASTKDQELVHQFLFLRRKNAKPAKDVLPSILEVSAVRLMFCCCERLISLIYCLQ
jgi:hypothetical protein